MATSSQPHTAKIYQFPVKARMTYRTPGSAAELNAARAPRIEYGSYHDAAIAEDRAQHRRDGH